MSDFGDFYDSAAWEPEPWAPEPLPDDLVMDINATRHPKMILNDPVYLEPDEHPEELSLLHQLRGLERDELGGWRTVGACKRISATGVGNCTLVTSGEVVNYVRGGETIPSYSTLGAFVLLWPVAMRRYQGLLLRSCRIAPQESTLQISREYDFIDCPLVLNWSSWRHFEMAT